MLNKLLYIFFLPIHLISCGDTQRLKHKDVKWLPPIEILWFVDPASLCKGVLHLQIQFFLLGKHLKNKVDSYIYIYLQPEHK